MDVKTLRLKFQMTLESEGALSIIQSTLAPQHSDPLPTPIAPFQLQLIEMFQTFTGTSRRPRQVNLSGRTTNPFASSGHGGQSAVMAAQQERERRQRERDRVNAAKLLQRTWRGSSCRRGVKRKWRDEWDQADGVDGSAEPIDIRSTSAPYTSEQEALSQLSRLLHFVNTSDERDVARLLRLSRRLKLGLQTGCLMTSGGPWPLSYLRLQRRTLLALDRWICSNGNPYIGPSLLDTVAFTALEIPDLTAQNASQLYQTLAEYTHTQLSRRLLTKGHQERQIIDTITLSLRTSGAEAPTAYTALASKILTLSDLHKFPLNPSWLMALANNIDFKILSSALAKVLSLPNYGGHTELDSSENRLILLGHFVYMNKLSHNIRKRQAGSPDSIHSPVTNGSSLNNRPQPYATNKDFVHVISILLSSIADEVNLDSLRAKGRAKDDEDDRTSLKVSDFVQEQILSLVNQESIGNLLSDTQGSRVGASGPIGLNEEAKQLASYALTLLRFFPRRGDEIRMWIYLGSASASNPTDDRLPAIKYFWRAVRSSRVFEIISSDSRAAMKLLNPALKTFNAYWYSPTFSQEKPDSIQDDWRVILVFLELYTFVLKLMDDEEFFSSVPGKARDASSTWASHNALPLPDVQALTTFLKNLGFTMYFNAAEITDMGERDGNTSSISSYFRVGLDNTPPKALTEDKKAREFTVAGLSGMSMDYVKGLATGLLRMIYERDSRRKFLPKDHWLMTSRFDMEGFIPTVVAEEENRFRVQEEDDADVDELDGEDDFDITARGHLVGTHREIRTRQLERLRRQQRKASRKRYLQAVAPRLEILQNLPFFIPFETRVQIFRDFVRLDKASDFADLERRFTEIVEANLEEQMRRRGGFVDPDTWRMAVLHGHNFLQDNLDRHHAKIRRGHEFDDAYAQFWELNEGLKEPIQITFVDKFDTIEAGIDGGGVTKEFLTSVTSEAFTPHDGLNLFIENENHLLYPNPAAYEEKLEMIRQVGYREGTQAFHTQQIDLLKRYEFMGRIIGKCLYEGILVDVNFAPFFLLKWALTGGSGSAPRESGYRANLNDLRDLDEGLYQGLLQLKNYSGDVEDFALSFTISDTVVTNYRTGATKTITTELKPDGANIPVTNQNRLVYISYVARHRLQIQPYKQTTAFLRGLSSMIQPSWLSMFNQSELQTLLGGTSSTLDIADLRAHTSYGGIYQIGDDGIEHPTIALFWKVMASLPDADQRKVLKFVTSTPRAPLLGFASLNPRFSIRDSGSDESRLPSTSTCVNLLKLPRYRDEGVLREKLLYAVNAGAGFDLS